MWGEDGFRTTSGPNAFSAASLLLRVGVFGFVAAAAAAATAAEDEETLAMRMRMDVAGGGETKYK